MLATPAMSAAISVQGPGVRDPGPFGISDLNPGEEKAFEVPVEIAAPYQPGSTRQVTVTVTSDAGRTQAEAGLTVAEPGWTMWMVSHFHYDPVWWNTQGQFTEARLSPAGRGRQAAGRQERLRAGRRAPGQGQAGCRLQVRAGRDRLPQTVLRRLPAGPRGPAAADGRGPGGDRRRQLQRAEHQPDQRRGHHPQRGVRHRVPAGRVRRGPAQRVDAGRVRSRPGLPGADGGGRPDLLGVGARAFPPVGPVRRRGRRPADAVQHRVRVDLPGRRRPAHRVHGAPLRRGLAAALAARPAGGRARGVRAVPRAGAGRDHPQRPAPGRLGPRHPGPLGDRHPPRLEPALRVAPVRHRGAPRVLQRRPRRGCRARTRLPGSARRPGT